MKCGAGWDQIGRWEPTGRNPRRHDVGDEAEHQHGEVGNLQLDDLMCVRGSVRVGRGKRKEEEPGPGLFDYSWNWCSPSRVRNLC